MDYNLLYEYEDGINRFICKKDEEIYDIAIIGAGASGLMFASNLDKNKFKNICLIDTNSKIAQKIKVSGGAKCNITNELVS
jgi:predicted flavoprotein YhiN